MTLWSLPASSSPGGGGVAAGLAVRLLELHELLHVPDLGVPLTVHLQVQEGHQGLRHDALQNEVSLTGCGGSQCSAEQYICSTSVASAGQTYLYDGGEEDGDDDGVLEELPVGAPVAGHHGEGDGSPQTPQHYDGLGRRGGKRWGGFYCALLGLY